MEKLTFREVIANIKEGEVYIRCNSKNRKIMMEDSTIIIENTDGFRNCTMAEFAHEKYELERNKVSFQEAFKAYESGKEIESFLTGCVYDPKREVDFLITINEIKEKWYINS